VLGSGWDDGVFALSMEANRAVDAGLAGGVSPQLLALLLGAGVVSSVNPCSAAALPAVAASVAALAQDRAGALAQAFAFALGSGTVLAGLGLAASLLGERAALLEQGPMQLAFPLVAVLMGLGLLEVLPIRFPGARGSPQLPQGVPKELQGFSLGVLSAAGSSPCATPVLVTVVSYLAANPQGPVASGAMLSAYALGYSLPLAVISAFAGAMPWLQQGSRLGPLIGGAGLLFVGTSLLLGRLGASVSPQVSLVLAASLVMGCLVRGVIEASFTTDPAQVSLVTPVVGEPGVYRYQPAHVGAAGAAGAAGSAADSVGTEAVGSRIVSLSVGQEGYKRRRVAALGAIFLGAGLSGAASKSQLDAVEESPEALIRNMGLRSPPLRAALQSGKPVVVDFSATWCPDCLLLAPNLRDLEREFGSAVQFVTLDVSSMTPKAGSAWSDRRFDETRSWAREFGVDGIPHLAFIDSRGKVLTALVGNLPYEIIRANILSLRDGQAELPFVMYDAFKGSRSLEFPPDEDAFA